MILYKYRSLANLEHVLDIILNQRLHCSIYPELNDPFEGLFITTTTIRPSDFLKSKIPPSPFVKWPIKLKRAKDVKDLFGGAIDYVKICSLSSNLNDVRLWSYYADGHKGVVIEIDCSGLEKIYEVKYSEELPKEGFTLIRQQSLLEVLSRKTKHWDFESEYRIIYEGQYLEEGKYFGIKGRIKAIYLGTRTSELHRKLLNKIVPSEIPIYTTKIDEETIKVEPSECIPERNISP